MTKNSSGFTLVEVLITVAIIGIMMAIAIPSILTWKLNTQFVGTIQSVASDLQRGKLMAVRENAQTQVDFNENDYFIYLDIEGDNSFDASDGDRVIKNQQLPSGYSMTTASFFFNGRGVAPDIANEVVVQISGPSGRQGEIRVNVLGRVGHTF